MSRRGAPWIAGISVAILAAIAILAARLSYEPNAGTGIYDSPIAFDAYVAGLGLPGMTPEQAQGRLVREGFRCEGFSDGTATCHRKVRGSNCAEQQFVDLKPAGAASQGISTRFGLTCR